MGNSNVVSGEQKIVPSYWILTLCSNGKHSAPYSSSVTGIFYQRFAYLRNASSNQFQYGFKRSFIVLASLDSLCLYTPSWTGLGVFRNDLKRLLIVLARCSYL